MKASDMNHLRNSIIQSMRDHGQDEENFLRGLEELAREKGEVVYSTLLNVFTQLEFDHGEARDTWRQVLDHRQAMSNSMARPVNVLTAICDYFLTVRRSFTYPKMVELGEFEEASYNSKIDHLTGLYNRGYFEEALRGEISRSKRYNTEFSLLFFDLDDFKQINDTVGHRAGDLVLQRVASMIQNEKRTEDSAARYGGEELVMILPETGKVNSIIKAERIRKAVEDLRLRSGEHELRVTISGGVATFPMDARTAQGLLECADRALYRAKSEGKNQVSLYSSNKRHYVRVDFAGPVQFQPLGTITSTDRIHGWSKDLSLSGILFQSPVPVEVGTQLQLQVPIPNRERPLVLLGTVARLESLDQGYDIGVAFVQMQSCDRKEILGYLQDRQAKMSREGI